LSARSANVLAGGFQAALSKQRNLVREAVMSGCETRGMRNHAKNEYYFRFIVGVAIAATAAIVPSLAMGVLVLPDDLTLVAL
jgi:hypothetical protein